MAVRVLARRNLIVLCLVAVAGLSAAAASSYLLLLGDRRLVSPVRRAVESALARQTGLKVSLGELRPAPFGSLVLDGLTAREPSGTTLLSAERLTVHLNPWAWLRNPRSAASLVGEVELVQPRLHLTRETDGTWSFSRYLRTGQGSSGWNGRLVIRDGEVTVQGWRPEPLAQPNAATSPDQGFRLTGVDGELTSRPGGAVQFRVTGRSDFVPGARLLAKGSFGTTSGGRLEVALRGVDLAAAQRLLPDAETYASTYGRLLGGEGDLAATLTFAGGRPRLVSAELTLHGATWRHPSLDAPLSAVVGRLSWRGDRLSVSQFSFTFLATRWSAEGSVRRLTDPLLDLKISGENASLPALSRALPETLRRRGDLSGLVSLDLAARGEWRNPVLTGFVRLSGVSLPSSAAGLPISDLTGTLELAGDGVRTRQLTARVMGGQVNLSGEVRDWRSPHGSLEVKLSGVPVEELRRLAPVSVVDRLRPLADGKVSGTINLEGPLAEPAVQGRLSLVGARWGTLPVENAELDVAYAGGRVNLERILVVAAGGRLEGTATASELASAAPRYSFSGSLSDVDAGLLASALGWTPPVSVAGRVSVLLAGQGEGLDWRNLTASGTVSLAEGQVGAERLSVARAGLSLERGEVAVDYLNLSSPDGEVAGYARWTADGRLSGVLSGQKLKLAAVNRYVAGVPLDGTADLLAELGGTLAEPELGGEFNLANPAYRGETFVSGRGRFQLTRHRLTLESLGVTRPDGSLAGSGTIGLDPSYPLDLTLTVSSLPAPTLLAMGGAKADVSGAVSGRVTLTGPARSAVATGEVILTGGRVAGYPFTRGAAEFRYADRTLELKNLSAEAEGVSASGRGLIVGDVLDLTFTADRLDLSRLPLPGSEEGAWQGSASFQGRLGGDLRRPTLDGVLKSSGVTYRGYLADSVEGHVRYREGKVTLEDVAVARGNSRYLVSGDVQPGRAELDLRLRFDRAELPDLLTLSRTRLPLELKGQTTGVLHVWGGFKNPSARLIAELDDTLVSGVRLGGDLDLALHDGEVTVNRVRLGEVQGDGLIVALGRLGKSGIDLQARARRIDIRPFAALLKGEQLAVAGRADADLAVTGRLDDPEATLTASVAEAKVNGMDLSDVRGRATYAHGSIRLDEMVLASGDHRLTASGVLPVPADRLKTLRLKGEEREWDLSIAMQHGDLGLLSFVAPGLRLEGPGSLSIRLTGPAAAPQAVGEVVADGVSVKHPGLNGEITGMTGRIDLGPDGIRTRGLTGRYNGGETKLSGSATLAGLRLDSLDVTLSGRDVHYQTPVFDANLDADLTVRGPLADAVISGRGVLNRSTLTLGTPTKPYAPKWNPNLDVTVTTREDLRVVTTTRLIDGRAYGTLAIRGRLSNPTFTGEAEASRGTVVYLNTPFRLTRGQAVFSAYRGILPTLDVTAETSLDGTPAATSGGQGSDATTGAGKLKVQLAVTGPVERLALNLSSDPPLSQADIIAALSLPGDINRIIRGGEQASGDRSAELLRVAGQQLSNQLFSGLEVAVADALQLDELNLAPGYREKNVQLHVGKYLVDNVYLTYNRTLDLQPYESLGLEYRILSGLTLTTSYDNKGEFQWALEARHRF